MVLMRRNTDVSGKGQKVPTPRLSRPGHPVAP
jgi:hypothetical protein